MQDGDSDGISLCDIGGFERAGSSPPVPPVTGKLDVDVSSPESLAYLDDALIPNPFEVSATVRYEVYAPAENATATLSTSPDGLTVQGANPVSLGTLSPGDERQVS